MTGESMPDGEAEFVAALIELVEEIAYVQPVVHSGRALDPQDSVDDVVEAEWLFDMQRKARKLLGV